MCTTSRSVTYGFFFTVIQTYSFHNIQERIFSQSVNSCRVIISRQMIVRLCIHCKLVCACLFVNKTHSELAVWQKRGMFPYLFSLFDNDCMLKGEYTTLNKSVACGCVDFVFLSWELFLQYIFCDISIDVNWLITIFLL